MRPNMRLIAITAALFCFWLLLSGHFTSLFIALGAAATLSVIIMQQRLRRIIPPFETLPRRLEIRPLKALSYLFWLLGQIIQANFQVARIILSPFPKISPHLINMPVTQKTLLGEFIFANSITLTPGTVSIETQEKTILIHALTEKSGDLTALHHMGARVRNIET